MVGIAHRPVYSQARVIVPSAPTCSQCSIVLTPILKIGEADGEGVIGRPRTVTRDRQGRHYAVFEEMRGTVSVFDARGRYVRTIGRSGGGPGEYMSIQMIHAKRGDTLLAFDPRNQRLTFILPTGQAVRSVRSIINPISLAELESGDIVVSGHFPDANRIGYPLHLVDSTGEVTRSFGAETPVYGPGMFYQFQRYVAAARGSRVWASHHMQYVIELWDTAGHRVLELVRQAAWFPPQTAQRQMTPSTPEYPTIRAIREDGQGRLWVLIRMNSPDYHQYLGEPIGSPEGPYYPITDIDRVFMTRVEVIDVQTGRVYASGDATGILLGFLGGDIIGYREDDGGVPRLVVWRAQITSSGGSR